MTALPGTSLSLRARATASGANIGQVEHRCSRRRAHAQSREELGSQAHSRTVTGRNNEGPASRCLRGHSLSSGGTLNQSTIAQLQRSPQPRRGLRNVTPPPHPPLPKQGADAPAPTLKTRPQTSGGEEDAAFKREKPVRPATAWQLEDHCAPGSPGSLVPSMAEASTQGLSYWSHKMKMDSNSDR